jgi:hypothetical protein
MIDTGTYSLNVIKPIILHHFGGVYLSRDFQFGSSFKFLHKTMDSYMAMEGMSWPGIYHGVIGARPKHPAMTEWRNFLLAYYGYRKDVYGARELMPMPTFREDMMATSGAKSLTFALWANLNKWGNNDCMLSANMMNGDGGSSPAQEILAIGSH